MFDSLLENIKQNFIRTGTYLTCLSLYTQCPTAWHRRLQQLYGEQVSDDWNSRKKHAYIYIDSGILFSFNIDGSSGHYDKLNKQGSKRKVLHGSTTMILVCI